jgi:ferredoxin
MNNFNLQLITPNNKINIISKKNDIILDLAEKNNINLPYSCRVGSCSTCVAKLLKGSIKHINQTFLTKFQIKNNFLLTCTSYITSNSIILTNQENNLYKIN